MKFDFIEIFGAQDGSRFALLLEKRPKWLLLVLYLRKRVRLSIREAQKLLNMNHDALSRAIRYLAGIPDRNARRPFISSTLSKPLIAVEMLSYREKYLVLTEHGKFFADKAISFLKNVAVEYGGIDVEHELGIPRFEVLYKIRDKIGIRDYKAYENKIISWDKLVKRLSVHYPRLLIIMVPEIIDAVPVEIETTGGTYTLYVII